MVDNSLLFGCYDITKVNCIGPILVAQNIPNNATYGAAMIAMIVIGCIGLVAALPLPKPKVALAEQPGKNP